VPTTSRAASALDRPVPLTSVDVAPWPDQVIDSLGHDPRSAYAETFWLPVLGPSACWLLRRLVAGLETAPGGFTLEVAHVARALGLGNKGGRNAPLLRTIARTDQFHVTHFNEHDGTLLVRRRLPPLNRNQISRLPSALQAEHTAWLDHERRTADVGRRNRARRLALSLFELGEDAESTERQLGRWRFHPVVCRDATAWALDRHRRAREAAEGAAVSGGPDPAA
jgi:hypothetical protein